MSATKAVAPSQVHDLALTRILNELGVSDESRHEQIRGNSRKGSLAEKSPRHARDRRIGEEIVFMKLEKGEEIMGTHGQNLPQVVTRAEWQTARDKLLAKEKAHMRAGDALAAERRRLPMVKIDKEYVFDGPDGSATLLDLFEGRRQLILYHFMFDPGWDDGCNGCSMLVDGVGHLAHLHARDVSLALVSRAPQTKLEPFRQRMGWTIPWYSSFRNDFNADFGMTRNGEEQSGTSVFLRDGNKIYRTYFTTGRGDEAYMSTWKLLDLTPLGRQEFWEDSPEGWPQTPPYEWWRHHDRYI